MPTFFVASEAIAPPNVRITGPLLHHLRASLRLQAGEILSLIDDQGIRYRTEITEVTNRAVIGRIIDQTPPPAKPSTSLVLAQALLKGEKMDWVIQKATELGVDRIVPILAGHSVVRPRADRIEHQRARWQRIAWEASQQSERCSVPVMDEPRTVTQLLVNSKNARTKILLAERSNGASLSRLSFPADGDVWLLIGPEGGWEKEEMREAIEEGFTPVTLGPRILRAETAAIAAVTVVQSRLGALE
ncbi:MAG TPA: 16S rRNA (uracil(1498)-N(3))-methyltransferase [Nitrospira sp.]|jgi:16S rRNA (uracil1498-N3)-methyltransferase|nr:16S rRNA (uracil(1498)-N(3))-methyltransferase [Nitrospira sp.]